MVEAGTAEPLDKNQIRIFQPTHAYHCLPMPTLGSQIVNDGTLKFLRG